MRISLPTHAVIELLGGLALLVAPFALGFGPAGTVVAVTAGVLLVGLALAGSDSLPLRAHHAFDLALSAALAAGCAGLAILGDVPATVTLAGLAALQLTLASATRWSRRS